MCNQSPLPNNKQKSSFMTGTNPLDAPQVSPYSTPKATGTEAQVTPVGAAPQLGATTAPYQNPMAKSASGNQPVLGTSNPLATGPQATKPAPTGPPTPTATPTNPVTTAPTVGGEAQNPAAPTSQPNPPNLDWMAQFMASAPWTRGMTADQVRQQLMTIQPNDLNQYSPEQQQRIMRITNPGGGFQSNTAQQVAPQANGGYWNPNSGGGFFSDDGNYYRDGPPAGQTATPHGGVNPVRNTAEGAKNMDFSLGQDKIKSIVDMLASRNIKSMNGW
jgi:hypothetical protein